MENCEPPIEEEQHVLVAFQHIVKAIRRYKNVNSDLRKLLVELDTHLSKMTRDAKAEEEGFAEIEDRFKRAEDKVLFWQSNPSIIWYSGPGEAETYIQAIYEIQAMLGRFRGLSLNLNKKEFDFFNKADKVLEIAMLRLEKELCYVLERNRQCIEPNCEITPPRQELFDGNDSFAVYEEESPDEVSCTALTRDDHEEYHIDLIRPNAVRYIRLIANAMFACNYDQEFCEAFIISRRDALDDYLSVLKMKDSSIEDVLKMDSKCLNSKIRRWIRAMKIIIGIYLPGEKQLCEQIFGDLDSVSSFCFSEISKPSILYLVNFGEAVAMGSCEPEKLFYLLNMYEVVIDYQRTSMLSEACVICFEAEFHHLSRRLGDCVRKVLFKFWDVIALHESSNPLPGGGIHPLTSYVMNYIRVISGYREILDSILGSQQVSDLNLNLVNETQNDGCHSSSSSSPIGSHILLIASALEDSLYKKSILYTDEALQQIFLLNNFQYIVQKVKFSELRPIFGDEWIRRHNAKFQQHAIAYERITWNSVLSVLAHDELSLKDRLKMFNAKFETVYRNQTCWSIPDPQLRDDVRISISLKLIQSYRSFIGKKESRIVEKYIKYTVDELENLLLDLFEGSPKSLRAGHKLHTTQAHFPYAFSKLF